MNGHRPAKKYFLLGPVEDDGADARDDDNDQPEELPQRGKVFSPCKKREVQDAFWRIAHINNICFGDLQDYEKSRAQPFVEEENSFLEIKGVGVLLTYEVPPIKAGLLGEFNPVLFHTHPENVIKTDQECERFRRRPEGLSTSGQTQSPRWNVGSSRLASVDLTILPKVKHVNLTFKKAIKKVRAKTFKGLFSWSQFQRIGK